MPASLSKLRSTDTRDPWSFSPETQNQEVENDTYKIDYNPGW